MAIGTPYASSSEWWGNTNSTSETVTCSANVTTGDLVVVMTYVSNEGASGPYTDSSATGFTHIGQFEPGTTFRGIVDVLAKYVTAGENGTAPTYTINFNYATPYGKAVMVTVLPGADLTGITLDMAVYGPATSVTFPSDTQDHTIHLLGNNFNNIDQNTHFPSGDTGVTWTGSGDWRQAGFAHSGGNTGSGTFSSCSGTFGTIHIDAAGGIDTATVVDTADIDELERIDPTRDYSTTGIDVDITSTNNVDQVEGELTRGADGFYWNHGTGWQAGADTTIESFASTAAPFTHNYTSLPAATDITEDETYSFRTRARDAVAVDYGLWSTRTFTAGLWEYVTDITVTADDGVTLPTCSIDTPPVITVGSGVPGVYYVPSRSSWREPNPDATDIDITGVSASTTSTIDYVETRIDVGSGFSAWANVTNTGTAYDTWSATYTTPVIEGNSALIEVRSVDIAATLSVVQQLWVEFNAVPVLLSLTPTTGTELAPGPLTITATGHDTVDRVPDARGIPFWIVVLVDETAGAGTYRHWNGATWVNGPTDTSYIYNQMFATVGDPGYDTIAGENIPNLTLDPNMTLSLTVWVTDIDDYWSSPATVALTTGGTADAPAPVSRVIVTDPYTPGLSGAPATTKFRVLFGDLRAWRLLGQLPVTDLAWSDVLNGSGTIQATVPLWTELAAPIKEAATTLWVEEDGEIVKGGIVWAVSVDGDSLTLAAEGFHSYLRRRYISSTMTYAQLDQLTIAEILASSFGTPIGLDVSFATSGVLRDRRYNWWANKNVGEAIDELAAVEDGFDFRYEYYFTPGGTAIRPRFVTDYPATGRANGLILDDALPGVEITAVDSDATALSNTAITVGEGNDEATVRDVRSDPAGLANYVPLEHVTSYSTVKNVSTLAEHAGFDLERSRQPIARAKVRLIGANVAEYRVGDQCTVKGDHGLSIVDGLARIVAINVSYQNGLRVTDLDAVFIAGGWSSRVTPKRFTAAVVDPGGLLLEDGDFLLLEDGDGLTQEQ